jgi:hypothetical protein
MAQRVLGIRGHRIPCDNLHLSLFQDRSLDEAVAGSQVLTSSQKLKERKLKIEGFAFGSKIIRICNQKKWGICFWLEDSHPQRGEAARDFYFIWKAASK